jgi:hypothetical protein
MQISADAKIPFPRPLVFSTYRDKLVEMVPYFPNVRRIEAKSRKDEGNIVRFENIWHGGGEIPTAARAFISDSMLSWTDHAKWDESTWTCHWRIETHAFTEAVTCEGENKFIEDGDGTTLQIRGNLTIDAAKLKGVPGFLAGKVSKTVEEFLGNKIRPNLVEVSAGVKSYLEAQKKG